jgi:hypothetical protein
LSSKLAFVFERETIIRSKCSFLERCVIVRKIGAMLFNGILPLMW